MRIGLQIPSFTWPEGTEGIGPTLAQIGRTADEAGFASLWVMDHFFQIRGVGSVEEPMLEGYSALSYLAGVTERAKLGTLVTGVVYRYPGILVKTATTLDVLSGGRAVCGLGLGWFAAEHRAYGWAFPSIDERYALLEDALQCLPLLWGKGTPSFEGRVLHVPEALCYPRPLQDRLPILVGGNGERRTLRLAATYADACNIIGELDVVDRKIGALRAHCEAVGRDPAEVEVTQLSTTLVGRTGSEVAALLERLRPRRTSAERFAASVNAGTVDDQIGRFRALANQGVGTAIVSLPDLDDTDPIERFGQVIGAFP